MPTHPVPIKLINKIIIITRIAQVLKNENILHISAQLSHFCWAISPFSASSSCLSEWACISALALCHTELGVSFLNVFIALRGTLHKCVLYIKLWECGTLYIVMHGTETSVLYSKFEFTLYSTFDFLVLQWSFLIPRALYLVSSELWAYHIRGQTFQFLYAHHDHACCGRSQLWKF